MFSHNQFKIMQLILKNKNESNITSTLNISQQTLKIQKFNIMYKLKLRRMSDIVTPVSHLIFSQDISN